MGLFDDAVKQAVPGGLAKPIMIALGALLLKNILSPKAQEAAPAPQPLPQGDDGGLMGGLGDLLSKFQKAGHGETMDSWIGTGANKPIEPGHLGSALGQQTISDIARQAGMSEQDLLQQLSRVLPGVVDKLTPTGRLPQGLPGGFGRV